MKIKILSLTLLSPLLYTACSSTTTQETTVPSKPVIRATTKQDAPLVNASVNYANGQRAIRKRGMMHIKSFMGTLKPTLKGLIQSDPSFVTAMGACNVMAQKMTNDYNAVSPNAKIRRTALKYRNSLNKPDQTDTSVMERFLASNNFKEPLIVEMPTHYRVYKALEIQQPCLACHGSNISPELKQMLVKNYPQDMATNFKLGEFRGVIVAEVQK